MGLLVATSYIAFATRKVDDGSGKITTKTRALSGYDKIDVEGSFDVTLIPGSTESVVIETDDNLQKNVLTTVKGRKLVLELSGNWNKYTKLKAIITYKSLKSLESGGSCKILQTAKSKHTDFSLDVSGSGTVNLNLEATNFKIDGSGSADVILSGFVNNLDVDLSGSMTMDAFKLSTNKCRVEISGSGDAKVNVANELDAEISGSGEIKYKGNPSKVKKEISGSGSVSKI